jgi:hypothetical protein
MATFRPTRPNYRRRRRDPLASTKQPNSGSSAFSRPNLSSTELTDYSVWMTVLQAARYVGYPCTNGRAPNSFYTVAKEIGHFFNGKWLIHRDDLDAYIRGERPDSRD